MAEPGFPVIGTGLLQLVRVLPYFKEITSFCRE
jgi:hypothetical protein